MKNKSAMAALVTGVSLGYMAAKKQYDNKSPYKKFIEKLEDYIE